MAAPNIVNVATITAKTVGAALGTSMNGLMAGPVSVNGVLNVDGNFVVV